MKTHHDVKLVGDKRNPERFRAVCSCGWQMRHYGYRYAANLQGMTHARNANKSPAKAGSTSTAADGSSSPKETT